MIVNSKLADILFMISGAAWAVIGLMQGRIDLILFGASVYFYAFGQLQERSRR